MTPKLLTQDQLRNGKRWVDALRSGKYAQVTGGLYDGAGYCCLGVACRLHGLDTGRTFIHDGEGDVRGFLGYPTDEGYRATAVPPQEVVDYFGWASENPRVSADPDQYACRSLSELNDHDRWTFEQIADIVEDQIYGGFKDLEDK